MVERYFAGVLSFRQNLCENMDGENAELQD
jgi:hypothetical protein